MAQTMFESFGNRIDLISPEFGGIRIIEISIPEMMTYVDRVCFFICKDDFPCGLLRGKKGKSEAKFAQNSLQIRKKRVSYSPYIAKRE